eukprot:INCI18189.1.p1 GENE.INCI18189.1~~INCI18189.1.p1  ORF type:complete len:197 (-),score=34.99 INCI18189.1:70-660(-)
MKKSFAWVTTSCVLVSQAVLCQGLLDQSTEAGCHTAGGKWAQVWLVDSGDNGMTLELTNTDTSVAVFAAEITSTESATSKTFAYCLDSAGEDSAPCYGIVTSTDGANHDELSWIVKITSVLDRTGETAEALRSGDVFDVEFIQCGKQYKKLGRYVANQLEKSVSEDAGTQNNVEIRTYTKMESKAIELGIQYAPES